MKLVVHVGMGKTGTSALQYFLDSEEKELRRNGIVYVGTRLQNAIKDTPIYHQGDVNRVSLLERGLSLLEKNLSRGAGSIKSVVWSNEAFSMGYNPREVVRCLIDFVDSSEIFTSIKFLLVLRRQDEWVESAYKQWAMKHKTNHGRRIMTPDEFVDNNIRLLDYNRVVDDWMYDEGFLDVVSYDDVMKQGGMINFFCERFSIDYKKSFDGYKNVHESLGVSLSKMVSLYNRGFEEEVLPSAFLDVIKDAGVEELSESNECFVSFSTRERLYHKFYEDNKSLSLRLRGDEGFFSERPVREVDDYVFDPEVFVTYLSMICGNQQRRIENLNKRLHRIEGAKGGLFSKRKAFFVKMFRKIFRG